MAHIKVTDIADLVVLLPYQLGFHPADSLVLADLTGNRIHGVARVDLGEVRSREVAAQCLAPLVRDGARSVLLAAWEETPGSAARALDHACRAAADLGVEVVLELLVSDGRFWSSDEDEPPEGRPVPEPAAVTAVAELVALGIAPLPGRASLAGLVEASPGSRTDDVAEAVVRRRGRRRTSWSSPSARKEWRMHLSAAAVGTDALPTPHRTAVLAVALLDRDWRDGIIAWLCTGSLPLDALGRGVVPDLVGMPRIPRPPGRNDPPAPEVGADPHRRLRLVGSRDRHPADGTEWEDVGDGDAWDADPADDGRAIGSPGSACGPWVLDGTEARAVLEVLLQLCRDLRDETEDVAAAALTTAAHVAWWLGDGALARTALERALRVAPGYRLAELFETVVADGIRPARLA
ncbi:hypothetical protein BN12_1240006 [Nostocoides japonicum T1-X7]|uniref:DUF4192 domain-containing protein n=1 Tax=Nostocoides japonicum T1-X7 TaxID=1194083 RepID=A0A077LWM1_9MICO|nr:DUF4192 family protein [Tetrasphaera japonica]CCH76409.1 hypothetical protein BN12_1240006 [Tetrasphaera japonica T1-X7]